MTAKPTILTPAERDAAMAGLPDWRANLGALVTAYRCASVPDALALITAIGARAEELDHHPDVDWRYRHVFVRSSTHSVGSAITALDVDLAARISQAAAAAEATAEPQRARSLEIAVDTTDPAAIKDFWVHSLGYRDDAEGNLIDPWGRLPAVWFQQTDTPDRSRIHLDLSVAPDDADPLIADIEAHGGRTIDRRYYPSFTVVSDVDGNRICICTPHDGSAADAADAAAESV